MRRSSVTRSAALDGAAHGLALAETQAAALVRKLGTAVQKGAHAAADAAAEHDRQVL